MLTTYRVIEICEADWGWVIAFFQGRLRSREEYLQVRYQSRRITTVEPVELQEGGGVARSTRACLV